MHKISSNRSSFFDFVSVSIFIRVVVVSQHKFFLCNLSPFSRDHTGPLMFLLRFFFPSPIRRRCLPFHVREVSHFGIFTLFRTLIPYCYFLSLNAAVRLPYIFPNLFSKFDLRNKKTHFIVNFLGSIESIFSICLTIFRFPYSICLFFSVFFLYRFTFCLHIVLDFEEDGDKSWFSVCFFFGCIKNRNVRWVVESSKLFFGFFRRDLFKR